MSGITDCQSELNLKKGHFWHDLGTSNRHSTCNVMYEFFAVCETCLVCETLTMDNRGIMKAICEHLLVEYIILEVITWFIMLELRNKYRFRV